MTQDSPGTINARAEGASVIQVDVGATRQLLVLLWLSAFVSAIAAVGLFLAASAWRQNAAHTNTLQYDQAQMKAQLIERGLYEPTSH